MRTMWSPARVKKAIKEFEAAPHGLPLADDELRAVVGKNGPSLLTYAADSGAHAALPVLLRLGAALRPPSLGPRLLVMTLAWGNTTVFTQLVAAGIEPDPSVLDQAVFRREGAVVKKLLARGLQGDKIGGDNAHPDRAPIHTAATSTWRQGLKIFLDAGVPVDLRTKRSKQTPFLLACDEFMSPEATSCVRFLAKHGANPNARDAKGRSAADIVRTGMANARANPRPYSTEVQPRGEAMLKLLGRLGTAGA
jgi:hypothetical protein